MRWGSKRAIFLDKDGTLVENVEYNVDPDLIRFPQGVLESLGKLTEAGFELVLVTNQSGLARGMFSERELKNYLSELGAMLRAQGTPLAGAYYCPHHPDASHGRYRRFCSCRKPNPGMLARAGRELGLDLPHSWMIGDLLDDVEAGHRAGCWSALVNHDGNDIVPAQGLRAPDVWTASFATACSKLVAAEMVAS